MAKLGGFFVEGFDDCLHQVKASFPKLVLSHVNINAQAQISVQLVHSESTDELFADDAPVNDLHDDRKTTSESLVKTIVDSTHHPDEDTPVQQ